MRKHIVYECQFCGNKSSNSDEIFKCESNCLGLTVEQRKQYINLDKKVKYYSYIVSVENNEKTRQDLDKTIREMIEFEEKHNMKYDMCNNKYLRSVG